MDFYHYNSIGEIKDKIQDIEIPLNQKRMKIDGI